MMLIGLLLVALACIVLGVVFASGPWFIGSLVASGVAAYLLWRQRDQISGRGSAAKDQPGGQTTGQPSASRQTALVTGTAFAGKTDDSARRPAAVGGDEQVWVIDGQPQYHAKGCGRLDGEQGEAVPFAQAVEDGFVECESCHPVLAGQAPPAAQVSVVDGQPEYHRADCARLAQADPEEIPLAQATGDGFIPCTVCKPDDAAAAPAGPAGGPQAAAAAPSGTDSGAHRPSPDPDDAVADDGGKAGPAADAGGPAAPEPAAAAEPERPSAAPGQVWVVDGRPRYHLADCLIIKGQPAEAIPVGQATEDGFMPCTMCEPNVTRV